MGGLTKYQGQMVHDIQFRGITGTKPEMLRSLLLQQVDEPLDREKLHASLEALYATGRFSSLQVEAEPDLRNGLTLTFVATENYFNGAINVEGAPTKTNSRPHQLVNATKLDLGELFTEDNVKHSLLNRC